MGKRYKIVLTTHDGLWRYRLSDVINIVGFNADDGVPVFVLSGRRRSVPICFFPAYTLSRHVSGTSCSCSLAIRLMPLLIPDTSLISAIQAVASDVLQVSEFTTVLDGRQGTPTVGYLVELAGTPGASPRITQHPTCI